MKTASDRLKRRLFFRARYLRYLFICRYAIFAAFLCWQTAAVAETTTAQAYTAAKAYLSNQSLSGKLKTTTATADRALPPASQNPTETAYYTKPETLASGALDAVNKKDSTASDLRDNANHAASLTLDTEGAQSAFTEEVEENADGIINGTYDQCGQETLTRVEYSNKTCQKTDAFPLTCTQSLQVAVKKSLSSQVSVISLSETPIRLQGEQTALISMPVDSGVITAFNFHVANISKIYWCDNLHVQLNGVTVEPDPDKAFVFLGYLHFTANQVTVPFANHSVQLRLTGNCGSLTPRISGGIAYREEPIEIRKDWESASCPAIPASCALDQTRCLDRADRVIDGILVHQDCWEKQSVYRCPAVAENTCTPENTADCALQSRQCLQRINNDCVREKQTWSCPHTVVIGHHLACGQPVYCEDGQCETTSAQINKDFGESATDLKAVSMMGEDIRSQSIDPKAVSQNLRVFAGRVAKCRDVTLGTMNCCRDDGWAKGLVMQCSQGEQQLGQAKEKGGLVVSIGRYCSNRDFLGICLDHKQSYCIFPSRIAHAIQVDGRKKQLHRSFGSPSSPDCSGLSIRELQQLDFKRIDFSGAIGDVEAGVTLPATTELEKRLTQSITQQVNNSGEINPSRYGRD